MDWDKVSTVADLIRQAAAQYGARLAFRDEHRALTFQAYEAEIDALAAGLAGHGVRKGDRVAILSRNRVDVAVLLGLCAAGLVPVPLNWRLSPEEVAGLIADCNPTALFVEKQFDTFLPAILKALPAAPLVVKLGADCGEGDLCYSDITAADAPAASNPAPVEPCCIIYTSGTTGSAKGVVLTHRAAALNCRDAATKFIPFSPEDVVLMVMPMFHVGGVWYYLFPGFAAGATTIIGSTFHPASVTDTLASEQVTNIHVVPTMLSDLLRVPGFAAAAAALRTIVYAGSSMPLDLLREALSSLPSTAFVQAYGSTEAGLISSLSPSDHERALADPSFERLLRSCGRPLAGTNVRLDVPAGSSPACLGEILVLSDKIMGCYWNNPEATAEKFDGEWLRTGDIGHFDEDGYLYIVDRKNDLIVSGGENIYPFEIEEVLCRHAAVIEAAAFGVPDSRWVECLVAAVVLKPDSETTADEIIAHVRRHLSGYKTPKQVIVVPSLPKNAVGKVLRRALRERFPPS